MPIGDEMVPAGPVLWRFACRSEASAPGFDLFTAVPVAFFFCCFSAAGLTWLTVFDHHGVSDAAAHVGALQRTRTRQARHPAGLVLRVGGRHAGHCRRGQSLLGVGVAAHIARAQVVAAGVAAPEQLLALLLLALLALSLLLLQLLLPQASGVDVVEHVTCRRTQSRWAGGCRWR
ncbi:hypothetical protein GGR56DRAFT_27452 [Xylariaceae sp. FL0804]|nr:hypothetical protein GGR56DRAFT_27452 [Xylariaceae sp. FL0804]